MEDDNGFTFTKLVLGLETEIPEDMDLEQGTYILLKKLEATGAVAFSPDGSDIWHNIINQLEIIAKNIEYDLLYTEAATYLLSPRMLRIDSDLF